MNIKVNTNTQSCNGINSCKGQNKCCDPQSAVVDHLRDTGKREPYTYLGMVVAHDNLNRGDDQSLGNYWEEGDPEDDDYRFPDIVDVLGYVRGSDLHFVS